MVTIMKEDFHGKYYQVIKKWNWAQAGMILIWTLAQYFPFLP